MRFGVVQQWFKSNGADVLDSRYKLWANIYATYVRGPLGLAGWSLEVRVRRRLLPPTNHICGDVVPELSDLQECLAYIVPTLLP